MSKPKKNALYLSNTYSFLVCNYLPWKKCKLQSCNDFNKHKPGKITKLAKSTFKAVKALKKQLASLIWRVEFVKCPRAAFSGRLALFFTRLRR